MKRIYEVNFNTLIMLLLPTFLREGILYEFLHSSVSGTVAVKSEFDKYREQTDYRLWHNGQTCYLRGALNDCFDPVLRRIYISETEINRESLRIFKRETERFKAVPRRPDGIIINRRGFGGVSGVDFVVNVPAELIGEKERISAITDIYKLVSKRYLINFIL